LTYKSFKNVNPTVPKP